MATKNYPEKIAFIIPGQGGQTEHMDSLANQVDFVAEAYEQTDREIENLYGSDKIIGRNISEWAEHGTEVELADTRVTQPLLVATAVGLINYIRKTRKIHPDSVAGQSLGGLSALYAVGSLEQEDTIKLGILRGQFSHEASLQNPGRMAALLNMPKEFWDNLDLGELELNGIVQAIKNSPDQILLSGYKEVLEDFVKTVQRQYAKFKGLSKAEKRHLPQAVMMKIGMGAHCFLMSHAEKALWESLKPIDLKEPTTRYLSSASGKYESDPRVIKIQTAEELTSEVDFWRVMRKLIKDRHTRIVEVGMGTKLTDEYKIQRQKRRLPASLVLESVLGDILPQAA